MENKMAIPDCIDCLAYDVCSPSHVEKGVKCVEFNKKLRNLIDTFEKELDRESLLRISTMQQFNALAEAFNSLVEAEND